MKKGEKMKQSSKDKISKGNTGKIRTQEMKDNYRIAKKGTKANQATKDKMRLAKIGDKNYLWKGEEFKGANGRWIIWVNGIKYNRSRYVAMKCLGRELIQGECVHHINRDKTDDRPENLYVFPNQSAHSAYHHLKNPSLLISNLNFTIVP